jgi:hypothetical protein
MGKAKAKAAAAAERLPRGIERHCVDELDAKQALAHYEVCICMACIPGRSGCADPPSLVPPSA